MITTSFGIKNYPDMTFLAKLRKKKFGPKLKEKIKIF
jgi:hypothetical protein